MPADASIYSLVKTPEYQSPLASYAQAAQIRGLLDSQGLNALQRQQLQQSLQEHADVKAAFAGLQPGADMESILPGIYKASPTTGIAMSKNIIEQKKSAADLQKTNLETHAMQIKQLKDQLATVQDDAGLAALRDNAVKLYGPQAVQNMPQSVSDPNFGAWKEKQMMDAATALERLKPQFSVQDFGGTKGVVQVNPNATGGVTGMQAKTATPGERMADSRAAASNAIARAHLNVTAASQDPFGILGIKDIAANVPAYGGGGGAPAAPAAPGGMPVTPRSGAAPTAPPAAPGGAVIAPPAGVGKDLPPIQVGNWQQIMGTDVHGEDFLKALPPGLSTQIKAYADGKLAFPAGFALKSPYFQAVMQMIGQYDPTFDQVNYNGRNKTYQSFTGGADAEKVKNINQTLHHAGQLSDAIDKLDNFGGLATPLNAVVNPVEQFFGDSRPGVFEQKAQAVASELRKVYAGTGGGGLTELKKWESSLPVNASKQQQKDYLQSGMELLNGALSAMQEKYQTGMGPRANVGNLLKPEARAILEKLAPGSLPQPSAPPTAPAATPKTPTRADIDAELRKRGVIR